ncbi:hypothetical protein E4T44_04799 [Aureobasidium sp. EXF-8845]|nr:hypothetical protein E4T44_04799 [Aureobasidium sp. EXF-8845]KAI4852341.1 hypothetical protein E4T45_04745 [Aureobasidium sp. EXF-8846]
MPSTTAAWLVGKAKPLVVKEADCPAPADNEVIIEVKSIALNPCDWAVQMLGTQLFPDLTYPSVNGEDVAGDISAVGSCVKRFRVGDRVVGLAKAAFQKHTVVHEHLAALIPASMSYEEASVIPLGLSTAAVGLFHKGYLGLDLPISPGRKPNGEVLLITGGSTSVGSNAVQMAVAAGYEVYSTSSPKNFDYVKSLGATHVFDYNSVSLASEVTQAFKGKTTAGALAIGGIDPSVYTFLVETCAAALHSASGSKFIALTMVPPEKIPLGIDTKFVLAPLLYQDQQLGDSIWGKYLPAALEDGSFKPSPPSEVVGHDLKAIQSAIGKLLGPRSHTKLVVNV